MNYGMTFSQMLAAQEAELAAFDDLTPAVEVLTLNKDEEKSRNEAAEKSDPSKPENLTQDVLQELDQQLENQFKQITATIERIHGQTLKLLNNTWESNEKYVSDFDSMASSYKQVPELSVINWTYGHKAETYLHGKVSTLRAQLGTNVNYLNNVKGMPEDALITKSGKALDQAVCAALGAPSSIENANEFMGHLRTQFRGRKSEKTYRGEMANAFIQEVRAFSKTKTVYQQDINAAERMAKTAHGILRSHIRNGSISEEDKRSELKYLKNAYRLITLYVNIIAFTYRLHVEYILNRRALITRLFEK